MVDSSASQSTVLTMPYPWQGDQWDSITALHKAERLPHAILLNGPINVGKSQFAKALAQRVICTEPLGGYACSRCKSCKLIAAGSHADFKLIQPEEEGKAIKVDQIRMLCDFVAKTAQQGGWKVVVIEPAEAMNMNAANALLKSLEEPSPNTLLILVCHELSAISATIRSRCRMLPFTVPSAEHSLTWLNKVITGDHDPKWLLEQAAGRPLQALKLIESDVLDQQTAFGELLQQLTEQRLSAVVAAEKCYRQAPLQLLNWLLARVNTEIRRQLGDASSRNWFRLLDRINIAKRELQGASNPNLQLLWESLLMDWQVMTSVARAQT